MHVLSLVFAAFTLTHAAHAMVAAPSVLEQAERERIALFEAMAPSVVFILTSDGFGSGFFVSDSGLILTNRHVVGTNKTVTVVLRDGRELKGTVVEVGKDKLDVALVKVEGVKSRPVMFASSRAVRVGAWAGSVGHGAGGAWTLNTGMITNAHGTREKGVLQTQIPVNPGSSGGPVFDRQGRVVGIVTMGRTDAALVNYAITAENAIGSLTRLQKSANALVIRAPKGALVFVDGALVGRGPEVVYVAAPGEYRVEVQLDARRVEQMVSFPERRTLTVRKGKAK
jgi:S1-C subfamily serine protease